MTLTLSPEDTGEITLAEQPTERIEFRRPEAQHFHAVDQLPRTIGVVPDLAQPDTMPVPPRPPQKVLVPLLRPAAPGELYADSRARRGLPPLTAPRGYVGRHRKATR